MSSSEDKLKAAEAGDNPGSRSTTRSLAASIASVFTSSPARSEHAIWENFGYSYTPLGSRAAAAEFVAMTLFVWIGCGTAVSSQAMEAFDPETPLDNTFLLAVATAFGFAITVLAYSIAPISGGHINPAVTFAFVLLGEMKVRKAVQYITAQCLGAILGAAIVWGTSASSTLEETEDGGDQPPFLLGSNVVTPTVPLGSAFLGEFMGTFVLVWTVLMTAVNKRSIAGHLAPIAIGWSVLLAHLVLIPFTGCGINPARSLGPMLVVIMAGEKIGYEGWWIFYTAPFVGAAAAAVVCKYVFEIFKNPAAASKKETAKEKEDEEDENDEPVFDETKQETEGQE